MKKAVASNTAATAPFFLFCYRRMPVATSKQQSNQSIDTFPFAIAPVTSTEFRPSIATISGIPSAMWSIRIDIVIKPVISAPQILGLQLDHKIIHPQRFQGILHIPVLIVSTVVSLLHCIP